MHGPTNIKQSEMANSAKMTYVRCSPVNSEIPEQFPCMHSMSPLLQKPKGTPIKDPDEGIRTIPELRRAHPTSNLAHVTYLTQLDDKWSRMWAHCERRQYEQTVIILTFNNLNTMFGLKCVQKLSKSLLTVKLNILYNIS
jgi:hypothetical protein